MKSMIEFIEAKKSAIFEESVIELLTPVVENAISFDDFVETAIIPVFMEGEHIQTETQLLNEFLGSLKKAWSKVRGTDPWSKGMNNMNAAKQPQVQSDDPWKRGLANINNQPQQAAQPSAQPSPQVDPERINALVEPINQKISKLISQNLIPVIQKISNHLKTQAYQTDNRNLANAADIFEKSLTGVAQKFRIKGNGMMPKDQGDINRAEFKKGKSNYRTRDLRNRYSQMTPEEIRAKQNTVKGLDSQGDYQLADAPQVNRHQMNQQDRAALANDPRTQRRLDQSRSRRLKTGMHNNVVGGVGNGMRSVA